MANNGIYYSSGNSLNFTTSGTTWLSLNSQGLLSGLNLSMSAVTANTVSQVNYIDFTTGSTNPSQTGGRVFFDNVSKALSYYDVDNNLVPVAMGQQLYTRVYNGTGVQIDKGKVVTITGTTNGLPSIILAVNNHALGTPRPIGVAAENISDGGTGLVLNNGILSGITLNTFANGDILYLSDTTPGGYVNSTASLSFSARTNEIGYVLQTGSTTGKIYVNINNEDSNLTLTDIERNILEGNVISSGAYEFTGMTRVSNTLFSVAPLRGWIVRNTYEYATLPDVINLYYSGTTGTTTPYINTDDQTYVLITSASTLSLQNTFPTPQQRRENIFLGRIVHPVRGTIQNVNNTVDFDVSPMAAIRDLWTPLKLINQGVIPSANGVNLSINTSAGALWGNGIGWSINQLNPDSVSISGTSPTTFQYRTRNGAITGGTAPYTGNTTLVDPANYDLNGVVTAVGGGSNSSTNQRIYLFTSGLIRIQYGQQVYTSLAAAVSASQTESFVEYPNNRDNGILIGILSLNKNASIANGGLVNTNYAVFNLVSKFGELLGGTGGLSTTTLQQAYDNSTEPEILINSTLDGLSIRNGTGNADNVSQLLQGINSGGTVTSFIRADGAFSGTSIFGTGLSANTISATTYDNLPQSVSGAGTTNYVSKWTGSTGLGDSQIFDNGGFVGIGTSSQSYQEVLSVAGDGGIANNSFNFVGHTSGSIAIADANYRTWTSGGNEIAIGTGSPLGVSQGSNNIAIGTGSQPINDTGGNNIAIGKYTLFNNQAGQYNLALGDGAGYNITSGSFNVLIGPDAGTNLTTEDNRLYIANNTSTLIYGEFDNNIVNINGTLSATTYDNLPGSSSANCFTTFYVTNISGCSPVNVLSPLNVKDGLSVTGNSTFTSQVNFTGGISASTFSATTYDNLPTDVFVSAGTYSNGQITFTNTTGGTFNVDNIPIGGAGGQPYYLNLSVSQTPYQEFSPSATTAVQQSTGVTINSGVTTTIANFLTPVGFPNITLIPSGYWSFYLHSYKADGSTTFDIFTEVYKRTTGGTETLLLDTDPTDVSGIGTATMEISDGYYSGTTLNASDRILVKVRATNTGNASSTITFLTEGTIHYSYGVTPFTNTSNVNSVSVSDGLSGNSSTGTISIINTDKGSSQNIFKNIQVEGVTQFSAGSNSSNLNFSGINITITSAATNTLVFSAGTGGGGAVSSVTAGSGLSGNSTTGAITLINTQVQGITGITAGNGISATTTDNVITIINTGVTGITAGSNISINQSTGNVTISSTGGGTGLGTVYTTANNFNFL